MVGHILAQFSYNKLACQCRQPSSLTPITRFLFPAQHMTLGSHRRESSSVRSYSFRCRKARTSLRLFMSRKSGRASNRRTQIICDHRNKSSVVDVNRVGMRGFTSFAMGALPLSSVAPWLLEWVQKGVPDGGRTRFQAAVPG